MPHATLDGLKVNYVVKGGGTPLIMLSPGGFDSNIEGWSTRGVWKDLRPLDTLAKRLSDDRIRPPRGQRVRGRVEPHSWRIWALEAVRLHDHLNIDSAWVIGGCMGVSVAAAMAAHFPSRCSGLLAALAGWRLSMARQGAQQLLSIAISLLCGTGPCGGRRARSQGRRLLGGSGVAGPWTTVLNQDAAFANTYAQQDPEQ